MTALWPLVVFSTRYDGVYEGGRFAALGSMTIPPDAIGGDPECHRWWQSWGADPRVAVASTVQGAYDKLVIQIGELSYPDNELPEEAFVLVDVSSFGGE